MTCLLCLRRPTVAGSSDSSPRSRAARSRGKTRTPCPGTRSGQGAWSGWAEASQWAEALRRTSVEAVAAGAGAGRVRVVDREALLLDGVHEVDRGAHEVRRGHLIGHHAPPAALLD